MRQGRVIEYHCLTQSQVDRPMVAGTERGFEPDAVRVVAPGERKEKVDLATVVAIIGVTVKAGL